jgi:hypothetical protein
MRYFVDAVLNSIDKDQDANELQARYKQFGGHGELASLARESAKQANELGKLVGDDAIADYYEKIWESNVGLWWSFSPDIDLSFIEK